MTEKDKSIDSSALISSFDDPHAGDSIFGAESTIPGQYSTLEDMKSHSDRASYHSGLADFVDPSLDGEFAERTQTDLMAVPAATGLGTSTLDHEIQENMHTLLLDCLGVLDDFDKLIHSARTLKVDAKLIVDMEMARKRFLGKLGEHDVEQLSCMGEPVTPELHEVVRDVKVEAAREGTVTAVERAGYQRHGHTLRRARVTAGKKSS